MTTHPQGEVNVALRRASSTVQAKKTKNSSNKKKECTSIADMIVKLFEWQQPLLNNECKRSAMMTITIMRQMENLNKSMDDCNCWDRKRRKKKCTKKRAKKRKKHCALEGLDDHGGKAGGDDGSSSSSSSGSSSDDSTSTSSND